MNGIEAKLTEVEESEQRDSIEGGYHMRFLGEKRWDFTTLVSSVDMMAG